MRVLIAEDDTVSRRLLQAMLAKWGYDVVVTCDGNEAWQALQQEDAPHLTILDWIMPGIDGIEICRKVRQSSSPRPIYVILLTTKRGKENLVEGFEAGADDYVTKPFEPEELRARVQVGARVVQLQLELANRVRELEVALSQVKQLQGLLPICSYCKNIRVDQDYWQKIEIYITAHSEAEFTHGFCPDCYEKFIKPELDELKRRRGKQ